MSNLSNSLRINAESLNISCYEMANYLLGKILVRKLEDDNILKGRIVETECYLGGEDKASHSYANRRTPRNEPMFMPEGTSYVYMTYGMYHCFNISSVEPGAAVLIRALEPIQGIDCMKKLRSVKNLKQLKINQLCNGPSKLCISMDIKKDNCNKLDLCTSETMWLEEDPNFSNDLKIVCTSRIGIDSCGKEWSEKPLRFYIFGNLCISKRDRKAENRLLNKPEEIT